MNRSTHSSLQPKSFGMPSGLTLLEMVAAMVLMTMLFAAMTSLLRCFADQERAVHEMSDAYPATQQLEELLRRDLTNARFVRQDENGLVLMGTMGLDRVTRQATGRRAEVTYRIARIDNRPWLLRSEIQLDETSSRRKHQEPVWQGAAGIELIATRDTILDETEAPTPQSVPGMRPMPTRMQLIVRGPDGRPLVDMSVVHHWEDS